MIKKVFAVVVTYNPSIDLIANVTELSSYVDQIYIVDNGTLLTAFDFNDYTWPTNLSIVKNKYNLGIATALNIGVRMAFNNGCEWILTLDQDTYLSREAFAKMAAAYESYVNKEEVGLLAPVHYDKETGFQSRYLRYLKEPYSQSNIVMSSGNLIPKATFDKVGFYDDDLFIEYVDHDFCLRIKKHGLKVFLVKDAMMAHSLGSARIHRLGKFFFFSHNYLPVRRYYRARNRMILYRRYLGSWIIHDQEFFLKDLFKIILVEGDKWSKIKAIFYGFLDGLLGRLGSFEGAIYDTPKATKYFFELREEILPLLPKYSERVMDLGCGSGETSGYLKSINRFGWVCGIEGSFEAAEVARKKIDKVVVGDIERIDFQIENESLDLILALDILEHLVDPWTIILKLRQLLKPGGIIIVSIPNVRHYSVVLPLLFLDDWRYSQEGLLDSTHIRFFTKTTAAKMFTGSDFQIDMVDHTGAKKGLGALMDKLTFGLFKEFFIFQNLFRLIKK